MSFILGINAFHGDSSACLIKDGLLLAAAEEERFVRIKHWAGLPTRSIQYCLDEAGIQLQHVDHIAVNQDSGANLWRKVGFMLRKRPDLSLVLDRIRNKQVRSDIKDLLAQAFNMSTLPAKTHHIEHHHAHLASAYLVSPFDDSTVVSVDGFGDFASAAWGKGNGSHVSVDEKIYFPHSLGIFYQAITQYLGFTNYGDEYKVMGLAPYGEPKYIREMRHLVKLQDSGAFHLDLQYFRHHKEKVMMEWDNGSPQISALYSDALVDLLGPARSPGDELTQRHKDMARSVQAMYEEAFFHLLNQLHAKYGGSNLSLAGGCAMNSVANGKIYRNTPYRKLYVQSAAGDAGGAIGAAFAVASEVGDYQSRFHMQHAYWGPSYDDAYVARLLESASAALASEGCSIEHILDEDQLTQATAQAISEGLVIGWFQGRLEWGPRALGNRSILGDPRRKDMKDILNLKIKRRESFRPFAPSILSEHVVDWFEENDDVPFMMQVYPIRDVKRALIPAVTHVDGSGRLQTVSHETNPRYWKLIQAFHKITDIPLVLNTSFNENEPVVCQPSEALNCFLRTKMDILVLGNFLIKRNLNASAQR